MICSILLPTRGRVEKFIKCVESLYATGNGYDFEVVVGVDSDDPQSREAAEGFAGRFRDFSILVGERGNGWHDLPRRYTELAEKSRGTWVWMFNDDVELSGSNWTEAIRRAPDGILHTEFHQLNESIYQNDPNGPFPIVVNGLWKKFGYEGFGKDPDYFLNKMCADNGMPTHFLEGVKLSHQREVDEILPQERY